MKYKSEIFLTFILLLLMISPAFAQTNVTLTRKFIDKNFDNMDKFYRQIKSVPNFKSGLSLGFKVLYVKSDSFFEKIGVQRGDILVSVDGKLLTLQTGLKPFYALDLSNHSSVLIQRGGQEYQYDIHIIRTPR